MVYAVQLSSSNDLLHFGIKRKSGRYPWGSGKRPYQSGGGPAAPKNETPEQREERKKKVLRTARSATAISEFADELSYEELDRALKRIDLNQKLDKHVKAEREAGIRKIDEAMKKVGQVNDWTKTGINSLKNIEDIVVLLNSLSAMKKSDYEQYRRYLEQQRQQSRNRGGSAGHSSSDKGVVL